MGLLDEAIREHLELKRLRGADPVDVARMEREALGPARRPDSDAEGLGDATAGLDEPEELGADRAASLDPSEDFTTSRAEDDAPISDLDPAPAAAGVYDDRALGEGAEPPVPADWSDRPAGGRSVLEDEDPYESSDAASNADDRSIAPASYGQETAEFDVESAVLGHEPAAADAPHEPAPAPGPHAPDLTGEPPIAPPPAPDEPGPYGEVVEEPVNHPVAEGAEHEPASHLDPTQLHPQTSPAPSPPESGDPDPAPARGQEDAPPEEGPEEDVLEETPDFLQETPEHERLWFEQRPPRDFDFDK